MFTKLWLEKLAMDKLYKLKLGADLLTTPARRERALYKNEKQNYDEKPQLKSPRNQQMKTVT